MDESKFKALAAQLRKPEGEHGIEVGEIMNKGNKDINLFSIEALDVQKGDTILEIGMGNGFFVKNIIEKAESVKYIGCDFSEDMIRQSSENNTNYIENDIADFRLSTAESLPVDSNSIDKIMTVNTIYFWEDKTQILAEFKRVLKPNGKLVIGLRPKHDLETYPMTKYGFNMFTEEDVTTLLQENGFNQTEAINKKEEDKEFLGKMMKVSSLIVIGKTTSR